MGVQTFVIDGNVGYKEINDFLSFYQNVLESKSLAPKQIEIILEPRDINLLNGEVDPIFLSYVILFLNDFSQVVVHFDFKNSADETRLFSLKHQLEQIRYLHPFLENRIELSGMNFLKESGLYPLKPMVDSKTGVILDSRKLLDEFFLIQSSSFIPPIFIDENWNQYFKCSDRYARGSVLFEKYFERLKDEIGKRIGGAYSKRFISSLGLEDLSFIEVALFRLLVGNKVGLYKRLRAKKGYSSVLGEISENRNYNREMVFKLKDLVEKVSLGLYELSKNVYEHASRNNQGSGRGVVTARIFDKNRLKVLKGEEENRYLTDVDSNFFLDINIVDLGDTSIKNKYPETLKATKDNLLSSLSGNAELCKRLNEDFILDINFIEKNYELKDFYVIDPIKINGVSHQKNKFFSRVGLHFFTQLMVHRYNAYIKVSSGKDCAFISRYNSVASKEDKINGLGTSYNCLVPIKTELSSKPNKKEQNNIVLPHSYLNSFKSLSSLEEVRIDVSQDGVATNLSEEASQNQIIFYKNQVHRKNFDNKYGMLVQLYKDLKPYSINLKNNILAISFDFLKYIINDPTEWIKIISILNELCGNIIIYDLDLNLTKNILEIRKAWSNAGMRFWEDGKKVLFYSKKNIPSGHYEDKEHNIFRYGVNMLAGSTLNEFDAINAKIWNHHYGHQEGIFDYKNGKVQSELPNVFYNSPFFHNKVLKYFEVLLKTKTPNEDSISLFEKSVQYSLYTDFSIKAAKNTNNKGYKIKRTHFRLGSKIHIEDFYYAKKLFQNSFFSTPLAYLLAKQILNDHQDNLHDITIVGYENYSAFLISTVRNLLMKFKPELKDKNINHLTISKDGMISIEPKKLNQNIIVVVPIASTFNTSIKIEDQITNILSRFSRKERKIQKMDKTSYDHLSPHYNVVLVVHKDENKILFEGEDLFRAEDSIYNFSQFNWRQIEKEKKCIEVVKEFSNPDGANETEIRVQKYFVPAYTVWHKAENCQMCFPVLADEEKCLFETGNASITPRLIIGLPKTKPVSTIIIDPGTNENKLDLTDSLLYGYLKKRDNRYLYYNRVGKLLNRNRKSIEIWISKIKEQLIPKIHGKKVVLVSPASGSRSHFIDMLNEQLFEYSANCLIVSIQEDYIENAESLYSDGLHNADVVIYVDDVLSTIASFLETNHIIKYIRQKYRKGRGIDYCITLINRMSFDNEESLLLKMVPFFNDEAQKMATLFSQVYNKKPHEIRNDNKEVENRINENRSDIEDLAEKLKNKDITLKEAQNRLYYFAKINNPTIQEPNTKFPLDIEREKYKTLSNFSSLDAIRELFYIKRQKLKPSNLKNPIPDYLKDYADATQKGKRKHKKLFQLLVLNTIYGFFELDENESVTKRYEKLENYFSKEKNSLANLSHKIFLRLRTEHKEHQYIIRKNKKNLQFVVLKIICSTPLIYYKIIREASFSWILEKLLVLEVKYLDNLNEQNIENLLKVRGNHYYSKFQELKFLLKKSVQLKSNYIINPNTLNKLKPLINCLLSQYDRLVILKSESEDIFEQNVKQTYSSKEINPAGKYELFQYYQDSRALGLVKTSFVVLNNLTNQNEKTLEKELKRASEEFITKEHSRIKKILDKETREKKSSNQTKLELIEKNKETYENTEEHRIGFRYNLIHRKNITLIQQIKSLPKYHFPTSKRFIYDLVALVQELVYEHEIKAIKLEGNILGFLNKPHDGRMTYSPEHYEVNGNFNHYLRLLRLENTEIILKLWNYIKGKELRNTDNSFVLSRLKNIDKHYENELRYRSVKEGLFQEDKSFSKFFYLVSILHQETSSKKNRNLNQLRIEDFIRDGILKSIVEILNNKDFQNSSELKMEKDCAFEAYLTVRINKNETIKDKDLYTFSLSNKASLKNKITDKNSITFKMLNGIEDQNSNKNGNESFKLSHLEVIKKNDGELRIRKNLVEDYDPNSCPQIKSLAKGQTILLVRITNFANNVSSKGLTSQAVLTIYINREKRIKESRLRLLLAARKAISDYLSKELSDNSFVEFIDSASLREYQNYLRHGITNFISYQKEIITEYEKFDDHIITPKSIEDERMFLDKELIKNGSDSYKEFLIITNSISGQTAVSERNINLEKVFFSELFKDLVNTIYKSKKIGLRGRLEVNEVVTYANHKIFKPIKVPVVLIDVIIPEVLTNQKKYGDNRIIDWTETDSQLEITIKNQIVEKGAGYGTDMCDKIQKKLKKVSITFQNAENHYLVSIIINR